MHLIKDYAAMSNAIYDPDLQVGTSVFGWRLTRFENGNTNGLCAGAFSKNNEKVIAFRGTRGLSSADDLAADLAVGAGYNTSYFALAEKFCASIGNTGNVVFTGHSLGGAVAQTIGNRARAPFVTFNAPGVALLASQNILSANPVLGSSRIFVGAATAILTPSQTLKDIRSAFHDSLGRNYRLSGDAVSRIGLHYGPLVTLPGTGMPWEQHGITAMMTALKETGEAKQSFPS